MYFCCVFFFCSDNMLYPQEDKEMHTLLYACSNCQHQVVALSRAR